MCYWKQWRWVRTKIKHLLALGVSLKTAIQHGVSSKSYWHMARTPALPEACQWGTFLRCHDELTLEMVTPEERQFEPVTNSHTVGPCCRLAADGDE